MKLGVEIIVLVAGAVAILLLLPGGPRRPDRTRRPSSGERPADLAQLERLAVTGRATAGDVHVRLRPLLRELAGDGVKRHGVHLDRSPARARELLGEPLWELVQPDRPRPDDFHAPGLSAAELGEIVARLERL